ncbi:MAG TPA: hypothetical protein VLA03_07315 [Draconibacterium sp.]|nr:hypothetical protein [Draconibacterium sp.]
MKRLPIFLIILSCSATAIWAQINSTNEKSIVKKEYHENGNLIQYDSTTVWRWNSDSTFNFPLDDNFAFDKDFPDMFEEFFTDSIFEKFGMLNEHRFPLFNEDDFLRHFQYSVTDSMIIREFPFEHDSIFNYHFGHSFPGDFDFPEFENIKKLFEEQLKQHSFKFPEFNSPEQKLEWERLMQKQQREKEELINKWEGKKL